MVRIALTTTGSSSSGGGHDEPQIDDSQVAHVRHKSYADAPRPIAAVGAHASSIVWGELLELSRRCGSEEGVEINAAVAIP